HRDAFAAERRCPDRDLVHLRRRRCSNEQKTENGDQHETSASYAHGAPPCCGAPSSRTASFAWSERGLSPWIRPRKGVTASPARSPRARCFGLHSRRARTSALGRPGRPPTT